jgi:putative (di)nucleoside polyphosphate hydrolase
LIDQEGYRANVAIVLANERGKVFWAKRAHQNAWQFPQGGLAPGETPLEAMYRELNEEVGLHPDDVKVIACTREWLRYRIPRSLLRRHFPLCIGQKQKWFLLKLKTSDQAINLHTGHHPEFEKWCWLDSYKVLDRIVPFKRQVYRQALKHFQPIIDQWRY